MSWNGTVQCGYCYRKGHNARTCPKHKEEAEKAIAEGNPDHWVARSYEYKKRKVKRQCSFCATFLDLYNDDEKTEHSFTHNKRTCVHRKESVAKLHDLNKKFRKNVVKYLNKIGIAPGALIQPEGHRGIYFVTAIDWESIFIPSEKTEYRYRSYHFGRQLRCAPVHDLSYDHNRFDLPKHEKYHDVDSHHPTKLIAPVKTKVQPPEGWVDDIQCVNDIFAT